VRTCMLDANEQCAGMCELFTEGIGRHLVADVRELPSVAALVLLGSALLIRMIARGLCAEAGRS
jgi:hypothetical protein